MLLMHLARGDFACLKLSLLFVMQPRLFTFLITKPFTPSCFLANQTFSLIPQWSSRTQKGCCHFVSFRDQRTSCPAREPTLVSAESTDVGFLAPPGRAISKALALRPEWVPFAAQRVTGRTLATAGLWFQVRQWTHVARSQMAPHPSRETWGQRAVTSIQPARPRSLTFAAFSVSYVLWPLRCKQQLRVSHLYNDSGQRQRQQDISQCL